MATNREMLKEAIADAKAVKETAIANAKSALEEAFTPQLKSMFAAKLQEMESDEDEMNEIEGFGDFDTKDNAGFSKMGEKALDEMNDEKMMEVDLEELLAELNEEEDMDESLNEAEEGEEEDMEMSDEESEESEEEGEPIDLEDLTDEDLKDMIEDVIKDMIEKGELEAGHEGEEGEESEESEEGEEDEVIDLAELLKEIEEMDEMEEPVDEALSPDTWITLAQGLKFVALPFLIGGGALLGFLLNYLKSRKLVNDQQAEEYRAMFSKNKKDTVAKLISLVPPGDIQDLEKQVIDKADSLSEAESTNESDLEEAYSTIDELKSELNEINLLNAKLLYTNKIFKAKNLNESQKVKVLTSFDKAKNVGEVKMVFETLNEGIKVSKNIIKENLGRASKGTMTPNVKKPIVESNEAFLRMQKLAGII
jgi:hypothetical protein